MIVEKRKFTPTSRVFLRIDTTASDKIKFSDGTELFFDKSYDPIKYLRQVGEVVYLPENYEVAENDTRLEAGDIVYFHHLASNRSELRHGDNIKDGGEYPFGIIIDGELLFHQPIEEIFAVKRKGEIICLRDIVFIAQTKVEEDVKTKGGIILQQKSEEPKFKGTVFALPKCSAEWKHFLGSDLQFNHSINIGDEVVYRKGGEYEICADFGKQKVYKMTLSHILAVGGSIEYTPKKNK